MNGPIAQLVALTCFGNAAIARTVVPVFFPVNSTCQFCASVRFSEQRKTFFGRTKERIIATPDAWVADLVERGATGIRMIHKSTSDPRISDRMSAGLIGGGGSWMLEVSKASGYTEIWAAQWDIENPDAPDNRIWKVTYFLIAQRASQARPQTDMTAVRNEFMKRLQAIHSFAVHETCGGFIHCFANAIRALEFPDADIGYHKDLYLPGQMHDDQQALLKAAMSAWVFGGMGSWNDMGFQGKTQAEYEQVSEDLFVIVTDAIQVAANSTSPEEKARSLITTA